MDAGSTENADDVTAFMVEHGITPEPAAVAEQNQNPVEREVQTLKKGVSALLIDQTSLGAKWWCYAVESWIATANSTAYSGGASPFEMVTGRAEDIGSKYRFPFGCPVSITKTDGREWAYDTINVFGIALGAVKSSNGSTLVLIPSRGNVPFPRLHVQPLLLDPPEGAITTVLELEKLGPIDGKDGSLEFFSAAAPIDLVEQTTTGLKPGTLGMSMFGISD
jgi:hypothetical protein